MTADREQVVDSQRRLLEDVMGYSVWLTIRIRELVDAGGLQPGGDIEVHLLAAARAARDIDAQSAETPRDCETVH